MKENIYEIIKYHQDILKKEKKEKYIDIVFSNLEHDIEQYVNKRLHPIWTQQQKLWIYLTAVAIISYISVVTLLFS